MRTVTAAFQAKLDLAGGAEPRILLEIDAVGGTLYYSDQTVTVDAQVYSSKVLEFGRLVSQIVPGEEVVRVASMNFRLSNIDPIDDLIVAGTEVRVYDWYEGLATADKALRFKGNVAGKPAWDDREISFMANDIFQQLNKTIGRPLLEADWALADPDYYGFTIPILIGAGENLECLPIEAGAASTLRADFNPADTTIKLTSTTSPIAFPDSGFPRTVIIGNEEYTYTGISSNDLTGVPTHSDLIYSEGSVVLEKTDLKFLAGESFSDTPVKALTELSILPFNSRKIAEKVAIDSAFYSINLTETISGKIYATIILTQINAIRKAVSLAITTQPNQPITTQQTQFSPTHKHPISNVTTAYYMDTATTDAGTFGSLGRMANKIFESGSSEPGFAELSSGEEIKLQKSAIENLGGTLVSGVLKIRAWRIATSGSYNMQFVINGVTKINTGITLTTAEQTFTSSSFSLSGLTWSDFQNANTYIRLVSNTAGFVRVRFSEGWLELVYATPATAAIINQSIAAVSNRIVDAVVGGDTVADTLLGRLICNFEGYKDKTDGHYTGTPTTQPLIEKPPDVIHFLWEKLSNGAVHADLDIAGSFLDARTNLLASYKYGFALIWQSDLAKLSAQLAQMAHSRFFTSAGLAKFARILDSGTPVKIIDTDDYSPLTEGAEKKTRIRRFGGALEEIINKVEIRYKHNPALGSRNDPDAYAGNSESPDSDAQASIDRFGERRRRTPWLMWAVRDDTMADDLRDKLLGRNQLPKTTTVFPSWIGLSLLEPSDLIELTAQKLRMDNRLSEILNIGNISQVPKNFQPTEIMITIRDLAVILEEIAFTINSTISIEDFQTYVESLLVSATATISETDIQEYIDETLTVTITGTVSVTETRDVNTFWSGATDDKLYLISGQFTSTLKDSESVGGVDNEPQGISYDGTNTPWCGNQANKLYLQSGQFTSTLKTSEDISGVDTSPQGISWDGTNTPWCGFDGKLYLTSGQFTATIKDSESVAGVGANTRSISWDGTNTPWCNGSTGVDKLYLQSGQFTSTLKTSENINAVNTYSTGISYQTPNTLWSGNLPDKLYLTSGQFTSTIKTSQSVSGIDSWCTDIDTSAIDLRF